jgi:hypothetical protein
MSSVSTSRVLPTFLLNAAKRCPVSQLCTFPLQGTEQCPFPPIVRSCSKPPSQQPNIPAPCRRNAPVTPRSRPYKLILALSRQTLPVPFRTCSRCSCKQPPNPARSPPLHVPANSRRMLPLYCRRPKHYTTSIKTIIVAFPQITLTCIIGGPTYNSLILLCRQDGLQRPLQPICPYPCHLTMEEVIRLLPITFSPMGPHPNNFNLPFTPCKNHP